LHEHGLALASRLHLPRSVASSGGTNCPGAVEAHLGSLAGLLTLEAAADPPVREEWWMRALQFRIYGARRSWSGPRLLGSGYNHPCRLAQRSRMVEMATIAANTTAR
jgi:hypothetical protein